MKNRQFKDTTDFFSIDYGDEIVLKGRRFMVTGHERERRFGMDDPKFWVKKAVELESGERRLLKLCFFESFYTTLAGVRIRCFRDPEKEAKILELVEGHPHFMQGESLRDEKDNNIRILKVVNGKNLFLLIDSISMPYEEYFHKVMPAILRRLITSFEAIRFLHTNGFRHGDIRNDHIIVQKETGNYVWIDFDYDYEAEENPFGLDLFGMGNILLYVVGKGFHNLYAIKNETWIYNDLVERLEPGDFSILDKWRLTNLQKLYPFIPVALNDILMHFSGKAGVFYETTDEIIEDLNRCVYSHF